MAFWLMLAAGLASFVATFYPVITDLWLRWNSDGNYSYALLVPVISAWLIWQQRHTLMAIRSRPVSWALYAVILSLLLLLVGNTGSLPSLARIALPLFLLSTILYLRGLESFSRLLFPLGFLCFMLPLPGQILGMITPLLQSLATTLGSSMLEMLGYPVSTRGNIILVDTIPMNVAEACSGLRYIFPLVGVGMLYSYLFETVWWKRIANVLMAIPIAVVMNGLRIALTGVAMDRWGVDLGAGLLHDIEGYVVLGSAFLLHFLFGRLLSHLPPKNPPPSTSAHWQDASHKVSVNPLPRMAVVTLLLLLVGAHGLSLRQIADHQLAQPLAGFPTRLPGWVGSPQAVPERITSASGAAQAYSAQYLSLQRDLVDLYIGYQDAPFREGSQFFHSPSVCLPGSGWRTLSQFKRRLLLPSGLLAQRDYRISEQLSEQNGQKILTQYWFQNQHAIDADALTHQLRLAGQGFLRQPGYDLFVRLVTPVANDEAVADARQRLQLFTQSLQPALHDFFSPPA